MRNEERKGGVVSCLSIACLEIKDLVDDISSVSLFQDFSETTSKVCSYPFPPNLPVSFITSPTRRL